MVNSTFILAILLAAFSILQLSAQSLEMDVIASSGDTWDEGPYSFSWTFGEVAIESLENESYTLLQGFHQPEIYLDVKVMEEDLNHDIFLFPNPVQKNVTVSFPEYLNQIDLEIFEPTGTSVSKVTIYQKDAQIDAKGFPEGIYLIVIKNKLNKVIARVKLIKI